MNEKNQIGEELKRKRIEKGYTLDDLQQMTKIQKRYLIAIEDNNFADLPGDYLTKAFIRQYAEIVGLDVNHFLSDLPSGHLEDDSSDQDSFDRLPSRTEMKRNTSKRSFQYNSSGRQNNLPTFFLVLFIIFILGILWWYLYFMKDSTSSTTPNDPSAHQSSVMSSGESDEEKEETPEEDGPKGEPAISVEEQTETEVYFDLQHLTLPSTLLLATDSSGRSWIKVSINDKDVFEGTLEAGTEHEIELPANTEDVFIRVGYLPSVQIKFGEEIEVPMPENKQIIQTQNFYFNLEK